MEETLDRLDAEGRVPKFIYTVPSFQNPAGVTMSLERRRRLVQVAAERELLVLEDNPYGLLRYEGDPQPTLLRARRRRVTSSTSGRSRRSSPPACASAGRPRRGRCWRRWASARAASDLCSSSLTPALRRAPTSPSATGARYLAHAHRALPPPARHDARRARRALPAPRRRGRGPRAACSSGRRCPTTSTRPTCWRGRCARTSPSSPGRAAYLDGRGGSSMRLNFSGVSEDDIREGVRRIGKVVREQVALYGTLTGAEPAEPRPRAERAGAHAVERRPNVAPAPPARAVSRVALLKGGRSLERQVSLRSGAQVAGRAGAPRPRRRPRSTSAPTSSTG